MSSPASTRRRDSIQREREGHLKLDKELEREGYIRLDEDDKSSKHSDDVLEKQKEQRRLDRLQHAKRFGRVGSGDSGAAGEKPIMTCQEDPSGKPYCKPFNDRRGCVKPGCPNIHRCDVRLSTGAPCNGDHKRNQCPRA